MHSPLKVLVAAGGTGGHLFPAVAVVEQLKKIAPHGVEVEFIGSADRMEARLVPDMGYPYTAMPIIGFRGLFTTSTILLPIRIAQSVAIARRVIRRFKPDVVLVTGAYISYPAGVAARKEGVPLVVMESNLNPGKTNARLAPHAAAVVLTFEESRAFFPNVDARRLHVLGDPVRAQIPSPLTSEEARRSFGLDPDLPTVLIFGGSLGARSINRAVEKLLERLAADPLDLTYQVLWQTGKDHEAQVPKKIAERVAVLPFVNDMGAAYAASDLVVSRSGATTIAELGIVGKPAILVPLPSASTNEQRRNASVVELHGAAIVVDDAAISERLGPIVNDLMQQPDRRADMGAAMRALGHPHAARDAAKLVISLSGKGQA
jgi:UDP-N-acetylglucosamine--N-acetylmuramyl-(pentapeptide) pyrophosphoryl-undecaprenol N-acetylglucosamine transferase